MTSPIPAVLAWPVLAGVSIVLAGRWWLLRDNDVDRLINRALSAALAGLLLREGWFEHLLTLLLPFSDADTVNVARQLSFGAILLTVSGIYGIAQLWAGADTEQIWQRQRRYDLVALGATIIILIAGTPARREDQLIDQTLGWPAVVAWTAFYLPLAATAVLVGRVSVREMRTADDTTTWRERAVYLLVLGIAVGIGIDSIATPIVTAREVLTGQGSGDPEMHTKAWTFFLATLFAAAAVALPLVSTTLVRTGWDRTGRYCRRLQPLWQDLTAAVPEIVLDLPRDEHGRVEPATRLHRMMIEIRDALLNLRRYSQDEENFAPADPQLAVRTIASAIIAKQAGEQPSLRTTSPRPHIHSGPRDLTAELRELLALAEAWSHAQDLPNARGDNPIRPLVG